MESKWGPPQVISQYENCSFKNDLTMEIGHMPYCWNTWLRWFKQKKNSSRYPTKSLTGNRIMLQFVESKKWSISRFVHFFIPILWFSLYHIVCETQKKGSWHSPQNTSSSLTQRTSGDCTAGPGSATSLPLIWRHNYQNTIWSSQMEWWENIYLKN